MTTIVHSAVSKSAADGFHLQGADALWDGLGLSEEWVREFRGKIVVVKVTGNVMIDPEAQESFAYDIAFLVACGVMPVVVHGGGPQISKRLEQKGIKTEFRRGYRVTTPEMIGVIREVLTGEISGQIAASINQIRPGLAEVVSGEKEELLGGRRRKAEGIRGGKPVDLGLVGEIVVVNPRALQRLLDQGKVPVVGSISSDLDEEGGALNVNADSAASAIAIELKAKKLAFLTHERGLYRDWPNKDSIYDSIRVSELEKLLPSLESGMVPKMTACVKAVDGGVEKAVIINGQDPHSILVELFTDSGIGTEVIPG